MINTVSSGVTRCLRGDVGITTGRSPLARNPEAFALSQSTRDMPNTICTATICTALAKRGLRKQMIRAPAQFVARHHRR